MKGTLTTLDSNIRLTKDMKYKQFNEILSQEITNLSKLVQESFNLVATYLESPYLTKSGWKGDITIKYKLYNEVNMLKSQIEKISIIITNKINEITTTIPNDNLSSYIDINEEDMQRFSLLFNEQLQQQQQEEQEQEEQKKRQTSTYSLLPNEINENQSTYKHYSNLKNKYMREKIGSTLDYYYCLYPSRTFCNLIIQLTLQVISLIYEINDFIQSIEFIDRKIDDYKYLNTQENEMELNEHHDDNKNNNNHNHNSIINNKNDQQIINPLHKQENIC